MLEVLVWAQKNLANLFFVPVVVTAATVPSCTAAIASFAQHEGKAGKPVELQDWPWGPATQLRHQTSPSQELTVARLLYVSGGLLQPLLSLKMACQV